MKKIGIIGSGFSSLSAACYLAKAGFEVEVFEKNTSIGGRARILKKDGFTFDMGPSWYWMPDVFEKFFSDFGKKPSDYYELKKLDPAYRVFFEDTSLMDIPSSFEDIAAIFEEEEAGSSLQLIKFINKAQKNYEIAMNSMVYKPGVSPIELATPQTVVNINQFFTSIHTYVKQRFKSKKLTKILEFPVLFLGAKPQNTPLFYNFMNYADFVLGTWYPKGGMYSIVDAMAKLGSELGVKYTTSANIDKIITRDQKAVALAVNGKQEEYDFILSGADYQHTETLLEPEARSYSLSYWNKKVYAPSALIFYVAFDKKLKNLRHHNLFFDKDFNIHAKEIYDEPMWPSDPLFYSCIPSITDDTVAPEGKECAFFLIPLAPGLIDTEELREKYFHVILDRMEKLTRQKLKDHVIFRESYCLNDFKKDYNAFKGNAYGLANTLKQTAFLRPKIKSKKINNLFFTGQLTVPGPGVPPALISGKIASQMIQSQYQKNNIHEVTI